MQRRHGFSWRLSSRRLAWHALKWRTQWPSLLQWRRRQRHHAVPLTRPNIAVGPPGWVPAPEPRRVAIFGINFKYRLKSITQRNLTEVEPSRKSAAARKAPRPSEQTASRERDPSCGAAIVPPPNQLWEDCHGEDLNSSGSGQRREARLAELRGGNAPMQMRERSRRGEHHGSVRL